MALVKTGQAKSILYIAAHTIAEFYRGGRETAREAQLLTQWRPEVVPITRAEAWLAGELLTQTRGDNIIDALVVATASRYAMDEILTTDPDDLRLLRDACGERAPRLDIVDAR